MPIAKPVKDIRSNYNPKIVAENNERENKYFHVHEVFDPNLRTIPLTGKFYSPYDEQDLSKADEDILNKIRKLKHFTPTQKYPAPITESQRYGWYPETLTKCSRRDRRFFHPKVNSISYLWEVSGFMKKRGT